MPTHDGVRRYDRGDAVQDLAAEDLAFHGEPPTLVVVEHDPLFAELLLQNLILSSKVFDGSLLLSANQPGQDEQEELPWVQNGICHRRGPDLAGKQLRFSAEI